MILNHSSVWGPLGGRGDGWMILLSNQGTFWEQFLSRWGMTRELLYQPFPNHLNKCFFPTVPGFGFRVWVGKSSLVYEIVYKVLFGGWPIKMCNNQMQLNLGCKNIHTYGYFGMPGASNYFFNFIFKIVPKL
jgi:hypothetical protein